MVAPFFSRVSFPVCDREDVVTRDTVETQKNFERRTRMLYNDRFIASGITLGIVLLLGMGSVSADPDYPSGLGRASGSTPERVEL